MFSRTCSDVSIFSMQQVYALLQQVKNCLCVLPMSVHSAMAIFTFRGDVFDYVCESSLSLFVFYFHWHEFSHDCGSVTFFFA